MVERSYKAEDKVGFPEAEKCSYCGGKFKGLEIVVVGVLSGYVGTYCSLECNREARKLRGVEDEEIGKKED